MSWISDDFEQVESGGNRKILGALVVILLVGAGVFYMLSAPINTTYTQSFTNQQLSLECLFPPANSNESISCNSIPISTSLVSGCTSFSEILNFTTSRKVTISWNSSEIIHVVFKNNSTQQYLLSKNAKTMLFESQADRGIYLISFSNCNSVKVSATIRAVWIA